MSRNKIPNDNEKAASVNDMILINIKELFERKLSSSLPHLNTEVYLIQKDIHHNPK